MRVGQWRRSLAPVAIGLTVVLALVVSATAGPRDARSGGASAAAPGGTTIEITDATSSAITVIEIIDATSRSAIPLVPPGDPLPRYVPPGLITDTTWTPEPATERDISTNPAVNLITPRTSTMLDSAITAGVTRLPLVDCVSGRTANPTSDHPLGRACDLMFDHTTQAGIDAGWRAANWLVANQAALGVRYVIWQGLAWYAKSRPGPWEDYVSTAYGCPNPANITGCHYDHVHVSMF